MTAVVTIGVFDGFHLGHAAVVRTARETAQSGNGSLVAITFDEHPQVVLGKSEIRPRITLLGEKVELLREAGVDEVRVLGFTRRLAAQDPERFLTRHLFPFYRLAALVVGYDFALGRDRRGTVEALRKLGNRLGFAVKAVPQVRKNDAPISSTRVRDALLAGRVEEAAGLLGRPYQVSARVVRGEGRGRSLGFPTANLAIAAEKLRPEYGVYAVRVTGAGLSEATGIMNLGRRPTFGKGGETAEVHILGFSGDLVGRRLTVELEARIREEYKFPDLNALQAQIRRDVERVRQRAEALDAGLPEDSSDPGGM